MLDIAKVEETIAMLQIEAKRGDHIPTFTEEAFEADPDAFNPYVVFGGNFDDAYQGGFEDGQIDMARVVLKMMVGN